MERRNKIIFIVISLALSIAAFVLAILPNALAMIFSNGKEIFIHYYSFFHFMPIGYAMWLPLLSSLVIFACIVILIIRIFKPFKMIGTCIILPLISAPLLGRHMVFFPITIPMIIIEVLYFLIFLINLISFLAFRKSKKQDQMRDWGC